MKVKIKIFTLLILCFTAFIATSQPRFQIGGNVGYGFAKWKETTEVSGYSDQVDYPYGGVKETDGNVLFAKVTFQYVKNKLRIGPAFQYKEFNVNNDSWGTFLIVDKFYSLGLKVNYDIKLYKSLSLSPTVEFGTFKFNDNDAGEYFKSELYYSLGLEIRKDFGRLIPFFGLDFDAVKFKHPDYKEPPTLEIKRSISVNSANLKIGVNYKLK